MKCIQVRTNQAPITSTQLAHVNGL